MKKTNDNNTPEKILEGIVMKVTDGEGLRKYSSLDLIRFANFKKTKPDVPNWVLLKLYNARYPELSALEKLKNIAKALKSIKEPAPSMLPSDENDTAND